MGGGGAKSRQLGLEQRACANFVKYSWYGPPAEDVIRAIIDGGADMGWFKKKPSWEEQLAQNIYDGLVAHNDIGDITALKLRIPTALHHAYQNKIVLQRELISFVALASVANPESGLSPVLLAYGNLLVHKIADRGLQMSRDQLWSAAYDDVQAMIASPLGWAQRWLSEFGDDPKDDSILFARHCLLLFETYKQTIEKTRPR